MTTWDGEPVAHRRGLLPLLVAGAVSLVTAGLWLARDVDLSVGDFVLPMSLVMVITFNAMTLFVLIAQYRAGAGPRVLILTWAFVWSAVTTVFMLWALPGALTREGLVEHPDAVLLLVTARHLGVPLLIGLALVPWSGPFTARFADDRHRERRILTSHLVVLSLAVLVCLLVVVRPGPLSGVTLARGGAWVTRLLDVVLVVGLVLLCAGVVGSVVRRRVQGIEAWAIVALAADAGDALLSRVSTDVDSVAFSGARALSMLGSMVVLVALLREVNLLQQRTRDYAQQLQAQNSSLTEARGLRDHLVAVVSHEMRSPLAGLQGYLEVLEAADDLRPEEVERMHARSRLLTRRLIMLTEDLLASATVGGIQVIPEPVNLRHQIDDCVATFPELTVTVDCPVELEVMADPTRLQQILANLVRNAQKYGVEPVCIDATRLDGATAQISVSDAGQGVDPDFVPRLFERYTRGNVSDTHGSGLGLSVARSLAERHGGSIDYDLAANAFVLRVPAIRQPEKLGRSLARKALTPSRKSGPV